jgi:Peptidase A4 family
MCADCQIYSQNGKPALFRFYLQNRSRNAEVSVDSPLAGTVISGQNAEWIMERPTLNNSAFVLLAHYNTTRFQSGEALWASPLTGKPVVSTIDNFPGLNLTMTNDHGASLSVAQDLGSDALGSNTMEFTWIAPQ